MTPGQQKQPAVDFGRRMAGSTEDAAVDAMEFGQPEGLDHLEIPSEEEARTVLAAQLPPPEARDLGSHGIWGGVADFHPMAMDYLPMTDEAEEQSRQSVPVPRVQPLPPPRQELPPDPKWVLAAPDVAQDMKRPASYWPDPLQQAEFCEAIDHGRARLQDDAPENRTNTDRLPDVTPYGQRVYVEERWDESRVLHPSYDGLQPMQQQAAWAVGHHQHPAWPGHSDVHFSQPSYDSQRQNRTQATTSGRFSSLPTGTTSASDVSSVAASSLAARLGETNLQRVVRSDVAKQYVRIAP
jgi:hypothetical protein